MLEPTNLDTEQKCDLVGSVSSLCQTREQERKEVGPSSHPRRITAMLGSH